MADSVYWDDLNEDLQDPEFPAAFIAASERIAAIDGLYVAHDHSETVEGCYRCELSIDEG